MKISRHFSPMPAMLLAIAATLAHADPVPLPDPHIPGYRFPEAESTILGWVNKPDASSRRASDRHGWGLWASLTAPSGQTEFGISDVPVYFTWLTPGEIAGLPPGAERKTESAGGAKRVLQLELPRQFLRNKVLMSTLENTPVLAAPGDTPKRARDTYVVETEGYDPSAAAFTHRNNLLSKSALKAMFDAGNASIPAFPNTAVTIKPVYKIVSKANMIKESLYVMPAWPGTPDAAKVDQKQGFPETVWPGCVYIDSRNTGVSHAKGIDRDCSGPTAQSTYGLGDFIHYAVTADNIAQFKSLSSHTKIAVGDYIILMAMHVTSREISEWTWQSFFWTPDPARPPLPSEASVAANRPGQLKGSAAHYAMTIAYQMVAPNQPVDGGKSVGTPVIAYNPYLEAGFGAGVFGSPPVNPGIYNPKTRNTFVGTLGIQTNCMSCHSAASVPFNGSNGLHYLTNFYLSRTDPAFKGSLQTEFLWSIADQAQ